MTTPTLFGQLRAAAMLTALTTLPGCPAGQCPERFAYCKGDIRHYCVSHAGSVMPDFKVTWETQDCTQEPGAMRCVEEGNDAICR
jgi:hypothetical protein